MYFVFFVTFVKDVFSLISLLAHQSFECKRVALCVCLCVVILYPAKSLEMFISFRISIIEFLAHLFIASYHLKIAKT